MARPALVHRRKKWFGYSRRGNLNAIDPPAQLYVYLSGLKFHEPWPSALKILVLENDFAIHHGHQHGQIQDFFYQAGHDVFGQDNKVRQFAWLQRSLDTLFEG